MILVQLTKNITTEKMFVKSWQFVTREQAASIVSIPGSQELIELTKVPAGFYKKSDYYFVEDGILRNGYGIHLN